MVFMPTIYSTLVAVLASSCLFQKAAALVVHEALAQGPPEAPKAARAAILVSGTSERLSITPLLENVVRPSVLAGMQVDFFICLHGLEAAEKEYAADRNESAWLKKEDASPYVMHPKLVQALGNNSDINLLFSNICKWARQAGAANCWADVELDEDVELPDDPAHRNLITFYNPITTMTGQALLKRWRTLERLWDQALQLEDYEHFKYNQVLVIRDDDYWIGRYNLEPQTFIQEPKIVKTHSCLEAHGLNDKVVHMGREAASILLPLYQAWLQAKDLKVLEYARNAEEFMFKLSVASGLILRPTPLPMAVSVTTNRGLPCFRKQTFNLTTRGGYRQCYGEEHEDGPLTQFFRTFNCDELDASYYKQLSVADVAKLHGALSDAATVRRKPLIMTITNSYKVGSTQAMARSLLKTGEQDHLIIVATSEGVCGNLTLTNGTCVELTSDPEDGVFKHTKIAIVATSALSGLSRGILFVEPEIVFDKSPLAKIAKQVRLNHSGYDFMLIENEGMEGAVDPTRIAGPFYVMDTPGSARAILRSWMKYVAEEKKGTFPLNSSRMHGQEKMNLEWALQAAVGDLPDLRVGYMSSEIFGAPSVGADADLDPVPSPPVEDVSPTDAARDALAPSSTGPSRVQEKPKSRQTPPARPAQVPAAVQPWPAPAQPTFQPFSQPLAQQWPQPAAQPPAVANPWPADSAQPWAQPAIQDRSASQPWPMATPPWPQPSSAVAPPTMATPPPPLAEPTAIRDARAAMQPWPASSQQWPQPAAAAAPPSMPMPPAMPPMPPSAAVPPMPPSAAMPPMPPSADEPKPIAEETEEALPEQRVFR